MNEQHTVAKSKYTTTQAAKVLGITRQAVDKALRKGTFETLMDKCELLRDPDGNIVSILIPANILENLRNNRKK